MPNCNEELRWTALPKLCQNCFGVKRKLAETENITSTSRCNSVPESVSEVKRMNTNTERVDKLVCPSTPASSQTLLTKTQTGVSDDAVCSSVKTTTAANMSAPSSFGNSSQDFSCDLLSMKRLSIGLNNDSKTLQPGFVQPLFKTAVSNVDAQLREADIHQFDVNNVPVTAQGNVNKGSDLHRCPLCDMVFDTR